MTKTTCIKAGAPKACPKKTTGMFYVPHPKAPKELLGPLLISACAERENLVMRSDRAKMARCIIESLGESIHLHTVNNGQLMRSFADADRMRGI